MQCKQLQLQQKVRRLCSEQTYRDNKVALVPVPKSLLFPIKGVDSEVSTPGPQGAYFDHT